MRPNVRRPSFYPTYEVSPLVGRAALVGWQLNRRAFCPNKPIAFPLECQSSRTFQHVKLGSGLALGVGLEGFHLEHGPCCRINHAIFYLTKLIHWLKYLTILSLKCMPHAPKARKPSMTAYSAFKQNYTIRKMTSSNEKSLIYQNTTIALFLFTAINTTLR